MVTLARAHRRAESALSYYLKDVDERQLYLQYGHGNTLDYARERPGFEERKTRSLLNIARSFEKCPQLKKAFQKGDIPWTKTREACERLAGKTLSDIEVFDLMCAETLCTYALTPSFGDEDEDVGGFARSIAERDNWMSFPLPRDFNSLLQTKAWPARAIPWVKT